MSKKDKELLISVGILLIVGWFFAGVICYGFAWSLCNKIEEKTAISTTLKVISIVGFFISLVIILDL